MSPARKCAVLAFLALASWLAVMGAVHLVRCE